MSESILQPIVHEALETAGIVYRELACDADVADTAAFCERYGFTLEQSANTVIVASKGDEPKYAACVLLATTKLDVNKKVCQLLGVKRASFASAEQTVALTDMTIGGVVAIGIKGMPIYVDSVVVLQREVVMGGGNRTSKVLLDPMELKKLPGLKVVEGLAKPKE